ncbi:PE/PPE C-terminal domain-containing protein, partial [[Mycobacterium] crassicus]|uniref:PE/PPE C-terminal domain-containing protein n=1 Tax=[Mycobacterium] crassicus TaxID=2872309 RepID=UPI0038B55AC1
ITQALASTASSAAAAPTADPAELSLTSLTSIVTNPSLLMQFGMGPAAWLARTFLGFAFAAPGGGGAAAGAAAAAGSALDGGLSSGVAALAGAPVSAGIGQADLLRALSVPPSWAAATPTGELPTVVLPVASAALPDAMRYTGIGAAGLTGLAAAASARLVRRGSSDAATAQIAMVSSTIAAPSTGETATKLRRFAEIIESGILTDDMLNELLDSTTLPDELLVE